MAMYLLQNKSAALEKTQSRLSQNERYKCKRRSLLHNHLLMGKNATQPP